MRTIRAYGELEGVDRMLIEIKIPKEWACNGKGTTRRTLTAAMLKMGVVATSIQIESNHSTELE